MNSSSQAKVLVVDDSSTNRMLLQFTLEELGFHVLEAADGNRAVEVALEENCAVIIMDINMPRMGGLEALETLQSLNYSSPIIACSAEESSETVKSYLQKGFASFIPKPIEPELVTKILSQLQINSKIESSDFETKHQKKIQQLTERFIQNIPITIEGLQLAIKSRNTEKLRRFCHILKANAGQFGFDEISINSKSVESSILNSETEEALKKAERLVFKLFKLNDKHTNSR